MVRFMNITEHGLAEKYKDIKPYLNERTLRLCAATDARLFGHGGVSLVSRATGLSRTTIHAGLKDIGEPPEPFGIRGSGAGRKRLHVSNPRIIADLDALVDPVRSLAYIT